MAWPLSATAAELDYRIGPDDVLSISLWGHVVVVSPDGKTSLPLIGEIEAGGLTAADLAARLTTVYGRLMRGGPVTVGIREIRTA